MKKIIFGLLATFLGFLGYSASLYLGGIDECPHTGEPGCKSGYTISECSIEDNIIYIPYKTNKPKDKTGSVPLCVGQTYGKTGSIGGLGCYAPKECCPVGSIVITTANGKEKCKPCDSLTAAEIGDANTDNCATGCDESHKYKLENELRACCQGVLDDSGNCVDSLSQYGINISRECLLNGQCGLNVYKVLGIRKSNENPTVLGFFQDITLASTTAILGTVIIIAIIISGLLFAFASITGKDTKRAKSILIDAFVGLLMVMGSYAIVRLIQFLATAGS